MKMYFKPMEIINDHKISHAADLDFLFLLQQAALMGLRENGILNEMQFREAEGLLYRQIGRRKM